MSSASGAPRLELVRGLEVRGGTLLSIGYVIGASIFLASSDIARFLADRSVNELFGRPVEAFLGLGPVAGDLHVFAWWRRR